ncbi:MAG: AsnC family protein [Candidatus Methanofastidiosum methylothiophilum]|jgi:DNA-binding Lrp family transcriptional regulator|uniref:AsnC family protein n=1 Tax=Candidatus Methanofastidiosum methylothiophilum TaxID=1705564 RepID=A0A150IW94_9EURY|nr:MAG: AsnC family protein [Candidatus Methanofastidiosum methylthiophilus]HNZ87201.1 Lrp/AsnC ligand binding domain-containing protein [Methanofastidiosum sp.]HOC77394.1 Lrp/AsnC ligand binding domain-containing protein [Methanofastidiosum sp.]HOG73996.1 Lrp/AsnC ligand binding domain-containing protein [Methanofastidiosum sp.]HPA48839.1 Lrp/AsnC ligand binding domain-containing protein [Methanofastidiosum sp.]
MVYAYVLITVSIGKIKEVIEAVKKIDGVIEADVITGPYDAIAKIKANDLGELTKTVIQQIHYIEGVIDTTTAIVISV